MQRRIGLLLIKITVEDNEMDSLPIVLSCSAGYPSPPPEKTFPW